MHRFNAGLKKKLERHYKAFGREKISPDPLEFPRKFNDPNDIESAAFISSVFAYGGVAQIKNSVNKIIEIIGGRPFDFIQNFNYKKEAKLFNKICHRFYTGNDIAVLFNILKTAYCGYGSLKSLFLLYYFDDDGNLKNSISFFSRNLLRLSYIADKTYFASKGVSFMFPDPEKGSACKRMNLFLRWMIRKDELDLGLWKEISPNKLIIPVDVHIARIARSLKLTKIKNASWAMAEDVTESLKKYDPNDPVKYDFALCHIGMRKMEF